jgi:hypothetical protein
MALKFSFVSTRLAGGRCPPKKLVIVRGLRGSGLVAEFGRGLELVLGLPSGWNVFAAGLGLNSLARTLNLVDTVDVGV